MHSFPARPSAFPNGLLELCDVNGSFILDQDTPVPICIYWLGLVLLPLCVLKDERLAEMKARGASHNPSSLLKRPIVVVTGDVEESALVRQAILCIIDDLNGDMCMLVLFSESWWRVVVWPRLFLRGSIPSEWCRVSSLARRQSLHGRGSPQGMRRAQGWHRP